MDHIVFAAEALARQHLDTPELANRWLHVQGVARRAEELALAVGSRERVFLIAAAWLHDIGYALVLRRTGMHAIDGAAHLRQERYPERLVGLVAYHTGAEYEAAERGLTSELDSFFREAGPVPDALTTADLTTSPTGRRVDLDERLAEILNRYPQESAVHRAIMNASPELCTQVERTLRRVEHTTRYSRPVTHPAAGSGLW